MSTEEKMTIDERYKYFRVMKKRYKQANKQEKGNILNEMEAFTGQHRKGLIRRMNGSLTRQPRAKQRGSTYGPSLDAALQAIAETLNYICAERLKPYLVRTAQDLCRHGELDVTPGLLAQLERISVSTIQRRLQRLAQDEPRLPRKGPERANQVTKDVPMKRIPWDESQPGHFEVDSVHHCGPRASGDYVHTVQMIDVATGWSERAAVLGRSYRVMEDGFKRCLARLPFPTLEIHPDNGTEFFNQHLVRFFRETVQGLQLSRSRPYCKNDNRNVEQKNATLVRAFLGDHRLDTVAQTIALNHLYDQMWLYYNFFQPVMRLKEKTFIRKEGEMTQIKRRYDVPHTPFDRLSATDAISDEDRDQLQSLRDQTNPRRLRQNIYQLIDDLFDLPGATPGMTEDIYQTLSTPISTQEGEDTLVTLSFD